MKQEYISKPNPKMMSYPQGLSKTGNRPMRAGDLVTTTNPPPFDRTGIVLKGPQPTPHDLDLEMVLVEWIGQGYGDRREYYATRYLRVLPATKQ